MTVSLMTRSGSSSAEVEDPDSTLTGHTTCQAHGTKAVTRVAHLTDTDHARTFT